MRSYAAFRSAANKQYEVSAVFQRRKDLGRVVVEEGDARDGRQGL